MHSRTGKSFDPQSNTLSTIGLCRRAGKLELGFDAVVKAVAKGAIAQVVIASDLSPKSRKELEFSCERHHMNVFVLDATMDALEHLLGKRVGIIGITDKGLAAKITQPR